MNTRDGLTPETVATAGHQVSTEAELDTLPRYQVIVTEQGAVLCKGYEHASEWNEIGSENAYSSADVAESFAAPYSLLAAPENAAAELEAARDDIAEEYDRILMRQGELLTGVANAVHGSPPALTRWSHHDLPELVAQLAAERDDARAAVEAEMADRNAADAEVVRLRTLYGPHLTADDLAREPQAVEWGVQVMGQVALHRSEANARADVAWWENWEANDNPNPTATKFPRTLVSRQAAGAWTPARVTL